MNRQSYCTISSIGISKFCGSGGISKMLKLYIKVFYVIGKVLSGELSYTWTVLVDCPMIIISIRWQRNGRCCVTSGSKSAL